MENLFSQLSEITGDWEILGEDLGVPRLRIEAIKSDEPDTEHKRRAVLHSWYNSQEPPCWEPVIRVLRGMGRNQTASTIERCLSMGCGCELVKCPEALAEDGDSERTYDGYSTIIGTSNFS